MNPPILNASLNSSTFRLIVTKLMTWDCPLNNHNADLNQELEDILLAGGEKRYEFLKWLLDRLDCSVMKLLETNEDLTAALTNVVFKLKLCQTLEESSKFVEADYPLDDQLDIIWLLVNSVGEECEFDCSEIKECSSPMPDNTRTEMSKLRNTELKITPKSNIESHLSELHEEVSKADKNLESLSSVKLAVDENVSTAINSLYKLCLTFSKTHEEDFKTLLMKQPKKVVSNLPCAEICSELSDTIQIMDSLENLDKECNAISTVTAQFQEDQLKFEDEESKKHYHIIKKIVENCYERNAGM